MTSAPPPRRVLAWLLLRSFTVQASWNYRTLIGTGFAFVLSPLLRARYGAETQVLRERLARHAELFNSHPYLVPVAAGAVARLEWDGAAPEVIARFKTAIRGALGSLGDQWIWRAWRPASALLALALLLAGAPWWAATAVFLLVYNALHLALRIWGLRVGWRSGLQVGAVVRAAPFARVAEWAERAAAGFAGFAAVVAAAEADVNGAQGVLLGAAAIALGIALGYRVRIAAGLVLAIALGAALFVRFP